MKRGAGYHPGHSKGTETPGLSDTRAGVRLPCPVMACCLLLPLLGSRGNPASLTQHRSSGPSLGPRREQSPFLWTS